MEDCIEVLPGPPGPAAVDRMPPPSAPADDVPYESDPEDDLFPPGSLETHMSVDEC
jgi:hypothetical protein